MDNAVGKFGQELSYVGKKDGKSLNKGEQWTKKSKTSDYDADCGITIVDSSFNVINKQASVTFSRPLVVFAEYTMDLEAP